MSHFQGLEAMDLDQPNHPHEPKGGSPCSICLELVLDLGGRSIAKLQCGHQFHLDCIGSAFNAKGAMQCPNCRKVEKGQWLYANGHRPSADLDLDGWLAEEVYDLSYSEPFAFQWCPIRGLTQLASLFEEGDFRSNPLFGDHSSASSSTHVCPYLALHEVPHAVRTAHSSSTDSGPERGPFLRHPTRLGGQLSGEMVNSHNFPATEPPNHSWQQHHPLPYPVPRNADHSSSQLGSRLPRDDPSSQQRLGSFAQPHGFLHVPIAQPAGHTHGHGSHMFQLPASSSSIRASPFALVRRPRPRGSAVFSASVPPSSADVSGFYGVPISGSVSRSHQDGEGIGGNFERFYGWGREGGSTPLPWIPTEGESQWWGPFHPNQAPPSGTADSMARNPFPQRRAGENAYHRMPPPSGVPPYR